jgi:hypothetical protein
MLWRNDGVFHALVTKSVSIDWRQSLAAPARRASSEPPQIWQVRAKIDLKPPADLKSRADAASLSSMFCRSTRSSRELDGDRVLANLEQAIAKGGRTSIPYVCWQTVWHLVLFLTQHIHV